MARRQRHRCCGSCGWRFSSRLYRTGAPIELPRFGRASCSNNIAAMARRRCRGNRPFCDGHHVLLARKLLAFERDDVGC
jgi:hypothetical protein